MQQLDDLCLLLSTDMDPPDGQNPVLDRGGSQQKRVGSQDLYFNVVNPKLQVADLKAEVGELRSGGFPQFNPCLQLSAVRSEQLLHIRLTSRKT